MDTLLRFDSGSAGPVRGQEITYILNDGRIIHQVAAAIHAARRHQAGTFIARLSERALAEASQLAEQLEKDLDLKPRPTRAAIQHHITYFKEGLPQTLPLLNEPPAPDLLTAAWDHLGSWREFAESHPASIVRFTPSLTRVGDGWRLTCAFHNPGSRKVEFLLESHGFELGTRTTEAYQPLWRNRASLKVGLMTAEGNLVDGLTIPAVLRPENRAVIAFRLPAAPLEDVSTVEVRVSGYVSLIDPDETPSPFPDVPMHLAHTLDLHPG